MTVTDTGRPHAAEKQLKELMPEQSLARANCTVVFFTGKPLFKKQSPTQGKVKDHLNGYSLHPD